MGISGTRGDLRKDVENGDLGRERGDLLEVFYRSLGGGAILSRMQISKPADAGRITRFLSARAPVATPNVGIRLLGRP